MRARMSAVIGPGGGLADEVEPLRRRLLREEKGTSGKTLELTKCR